MRKKKAQNTYIDVNLIPFSGTFSGTSMLPISIFFIPSFAVSKIHGIPESGARRKREGGEKERDRALHEIQNKTIAYARSITINPKCMAT